MKHLISGACVGMLVFVYFVSLQTWIGRDAQSASLARIEARLKEMAP